MMFWNHVSNRLSAYLHGELGPEESRRVAEHLMICPRCRDEHEEIKFGSQMASRLSKDLARAQAPATLWAELEEMIGGAEAGRRRPGAAPGAVAIWWKIATAGAVALASALVVFWFYPRAPRPALHSGLDVTRIEGAPRIGSKTVGESGKLRVGEWLVTDDSSSAEIRVGEIGQVQVDPGSRVRLVEAKADEHRLALDRGKMQAFIWAPPRQFYVDTPSAVAVDLGCAYTLEVGADGRGLLSVIAGWVAFEWQGRETFVPAMAMCVTRPRLGPGTPYFSDASEDFQNALAIFDLAESGSDARSNALQTALAKSRKRDALTLWHLLARADGDDRLRVYNRLAELIPPPAQATPEAVMRGDRAALDLWWEKLELGSAEWWRIWKGPVPSQTK
ncbi:MAG: zf-HC2 domain-containing protein [Blastocatellia bacterium]|nr:zf-HC2 domain-containing protein [Blastocatellia bacterium]